MSTIDVPLPFNVAAEQAVLGALLRDNEAFDQLDGLAVEHFYRHDHRELFKVLSAMILASTPADIITTHERLMADSPDTGLTMAYLNEIEFSAPVVANIRRYSAIVRERAQRRQLIVVSQELGAAASAGEEDAREMIDQAQGKLERIAESRVGRDPVLVGDFGTEWMEEFEKRLDGRSAAIPTGFPDLDRLLSGGMRPGQLIVVAARPKMGKTGLTANIAHHVSEQGLTTLTLSMEMSRVDLHDRNMAAVGRIGLDRLLQPKLMTEADWPMFTFAMQKMQTWPMFIDDQGGLRLSDIRAKARKVKRTHGLKLLLIDYLQLMEGEGDNRNAQIEQITRGLKTLAKELAIPILLLSQLNRKVEERPNKRPMPSDLRDSGAIEQDCDVALFLYRDEVYNPDTMDRGIVEVNVALNRQGGTGVVGLLFAAEQVRFESLQYGHQFGRVAESRRPTIKDV